MNGEREYTCILNIDQIPNSNKNIKYIIFDFQKEKKNKRNNIYISTKEDKANNIGTIFKLPLFGSNKIIIPYDYIKLENKLYVKIFCYEKQKCNEEIYINAYDKIEIEEGETLYINGYEQNYNYNFIYNYEQNKDENIIKQISAYSYQKNDFELNIINNNMNIDTEPIMNGYLYSIKNKKHKDYTYELNIKIKKPSAYIILQIISIDSNIKYNNIELIRPIIGVITNEEKKKCFYIEENEEESKDYFIDFMIEDDLQALIFENEIKEPKNILFSQTINYYSEEGKFCIKKFYPQKNSIHFYFTVYIPEKEDFFITSDHNQYIVHKSYLGLLYNGYFYKKLSVENYFYNAFYPAEYNSNVLYFYIYSIKGLIKVSNVVTNNFPYYNIGEEKANNQETFELKNIKIIGNEYFGKIILKDPNINSSPMNSNKNIILVKCQSGVKFQGEENSYCMYNIICYTENDLILLRNNEKFSFINYNKINLNMQISQNFEMNKDKMIIDTYSHFGSSYIDISNEDENSNINTFYNGHLISNEIIHDYRKDKDNFINYKIKAVSYDYDYISIIITGNVDTDDDILKSNFWINDFILTTLTERIPKKQFKIDHIPNALSDITFYKTFFLFKYSNCEVDTKLLFNKNISNNFQNLKDEKIDDTQLISFEGMHSESKNIIEFEFNLKNINNNEPICMIYFSSFLIVDLNFDLSPLYPMLIKENTDTPIIFRFKEDYVIQLEYLIFNYDSPIIISISFEEMIEFNFAYSIEESKVKYYILYYSQNIIIYQKEIKEKCNKDENDENKLCKLRIDIKKTYNSRYQTKYFADTALLNIKIKSNYEDHVSYLNLNTLTDGIILGDQFQYYYSNIRQYDSGIITLNNKNGLGIMYARIINKNTVDENLDKNWNGRIHLLNKKELENCEDCLIYNINTNEIIISEQNTKDCTIDLRCQIIIGVANIENKDNDNADEYSVYEYNIYFLKNNLKNNIFGNLKIQSNKYIKSSLDKNNKIIYEYYLPDNVENVKYELQCKSCSFSLIDGDNKIIQKIEDENIIKKYGMNLIKFPNDDITKFYNKIIYLEFSSNEKDLLFFRISLLFNGMIEHLSLLTSEMNSICYKECYYLIPINDYDKLTSLTMSISDKNLNANINSELEFMIYNSTDYYSYILFKNYTYSPDVGISSIKPKIDNIKSKKNYIIFENNYNYNNMIIVGHVIIKDEIDINKLNPFYIYFTYSKNSRKNYFLYPNRNNLLFINKNSEKENIKEIRIPEYFLIKNAEEKEKDFSIITFSHIKGDGVIELITNNNYIHNNIRKLYTELKSFKFDKSHSFFQINYDVNSNFSKKFFINSDTGLYTYANITTNLQRNVNEIKLGKANYIINRYDGDAKYLYLKINNKEITKNDITIDIKIEGLDVYKNYDININGYINYEEDFINKKILLSKAFYDNITNIGIIKFLSKDMENYYKQDKNNYLIILISFNITNNPSLDIMIKATPISSFFEQLNDEKFETPIPQFEHFFSYIDFSVNNYIIYKLNIINKEHNFISIELHFLSYQTTEFSLHSNKSHIFKNNLEYLLKNETSEDSFMIVDERNQNNKRSIIINIKNEKKEIFLVILNKGGKRGLDKEFFSLKYYSLSNDDYQKGKYLYKNRYTIKNTKLNISKEQNIINWEKIELTNIKPNKGEIKINYYLKINKILKNDDLSKDNNGLFSCYNQCKENFGVHLINKNEYKLMNNINTKENLEIHLIAKFNELNGMENFLLYEPLLLIKENQEKKENNETNRKNIDIKYIILRIFIFILLLVVIALIILSIYKFYRRIQIKNAYDKYIKGNNDNKGDMALLSEEKLPFESKISFLIEN